MASGDHSPLARLTELLAWDLVPMGDVAALLDGLDNAARIEVVQNLGRREQRSLWESTKGLPITLEQLVPAQVPELTPVRHHGRNTLPAFTRFEKRFFRDGDAIYGANFQLVSPLTGPGYFSVRAAPARHELFIDYTVLPHRAPAGWPPIVSAERGLSRLVYGGLSDHVRRVSAHVTIGMPARRGKPLGSWFVLCRDSAKDSA